MAFNFKESAKKATVISDLMEGREKIKVSDIINDEVLAGQVTLTDFDIVNGADKNGNPITYPIFTYKEDESKFFNGGYVLNKVVNQWLAEFDDNMEKCRQEFRAAGGVTIVMTSSQTKGGHNIVNVDFK